MLKSALTPYQRGAIAMLDLISKKEGWEESKKYYHDLFFTEGYRGTRPVKYKTPEEAYEAKKKTAREWYWKKKGVTAKTIQERIDAKRAENAMKDDMKIIES